MALAETAAPETGGVTAVAHGKGDEVLLSVRDLHVHFHTSRGIVRAVEGVSYEVRPGEVLAIVGESGCGKSVSSLAVMGLLAKPAGRVEKGEIIFDGRDLLKLSGEDMRAIRGRDIAMIFQEPMTSLNPVLTIGLQVMEPLLIHLAMTEAQARARAVELLTLVGITDPDRRLDQYPHQMSGGMRQRIMIAIGLACNPKLIIADEPTTALDVTIQAQILELMKDLSRRLGIAMVIITHNLGIVARYADRVAVMYAARIVETGSADDIFLKPRHPYAVGLMRSVPRLDRPRGARLQTIEGMPPDLRNPPVGCRFAPRCPLKIAVCEAQAPDLLGVGPAHFARCHRSADLAAGLAVFAEEGTAPSAAIDYTGAPILAVEGLKTHFWVSRKTSWFSSELATVKAVDDVSFAIRKGETLGLVGESGCGKTTVGRTVLRLENPTEGAIRFEGQDLAHLSQKELRPVRRRMQVVFQDPFSSLNPRMTVGDIIAEPMLVHGIAATKAEARARVDDYLTRVGLFPYMAERYPHEMSGGQRQRIGIARALAFEPQLIVCDEPVSALDVSIQGQVINLLEDLKRQFDLTFLFIAHDLAVVRHISDRIIVMYLGRIMEVADRDALYAEPLHPYTRALLDAAPVPDPVKERGRKPRALAGEIPSPLNPPKGCVFHTRCPLADDHCRTVVPAARELAGHVVACHKA
ncbi:ABC transporter ATP-binding protein [Phreatobacter stygius]|uniref:ABC transporter ATP-binding protein n=2 Tax=Phreatobacter stygius TaxID=1940610 RepID=A0A4D7BP04_9HYPH|nr:ABC transporter ATP-binding protein [Phreatobacter stygius]